MAQTIAVNSGSPQIETSGFFQPLQVIVRDANSLPIAGATVKFLAPQTGPSGDFHPTSTCNGITQRYADTATTNISGIATPSQLSSNHQGQYNVGMFQPNNGPIWALDANGNGRWDGPAAGDKYFPFIGQPGSIAVVGDWNGDGTSKVGVFFNGNWMLDYNGNGVWDGAAGGDKLYVF